MARGLVVFAAVFALASPVARAQQLQRLHVQAFTLQSSALRPQFEVPFEVTVTIRVSERVAALENVYLPTLGGAEELGDERQTIVTRSGTVYRETLRLVVHARGLTSIGSAYLDAIDARDGKPKRFISNGLTLAVQGGAALDAGTPVRAIAWTLAGAAIALALAALLMRRDAAPRDPVQPAHPPPPVLKDDELERALGELRARRDRSSLMRVRAALWRQAGAQRGQTLSDVLLQPHSFDERVRGLLLRVEYAAFVEERGLQRALDEVLAQREGSPA